MVWIKKKIIKGHSYSALYESKRVNGKPKSFFIRHLGRNVNYSLVSQMRRYSKGKIGNVTASEMRMAVKKETGITPNVKVVYLPREEYIDKAWEENPDRKLTVLNSNAFIDRNTNTIFIDKDQTDLDKARATIHEMIHDVGGLPHERFEEGFVDHETKKILVEEFGIPEERAGQSLGYPDEAAIIDKIEDDVGEEALREAYVNGTWDPLKTAYRKQGKDFGMRVRQLASE